MTLWPWLIHCSIFFYYLLAQPIAQFRGQATDIDIARNEVRNIKNELVFTYMYFFPTHCSAKMFVYFSMSYEQVGKGISINNAFVWWECQVALYAKHTGHSKEKIEEDIRRPKYFSPDEAMEYGIIDKVNLSPIW